MVYRTLDHGVCTAFGGGTVGGSITIRVLKYSATALLILVAIGLQQVGAWSDGRQLCNLDPYTCVDSTHARKQ